MPRKTDKANVENAEFKQALGQLIVELRRERGLSQEQLALTAEVDRTRMSQIERGEANVSIDTLIKIADALDLTLASLFVQVEAAERLPHSSGG